MTAMILMKRVVCVYFARKNMRDVSDSFSSNEENNHLNSGNDQGNKVGETRIEART